MWSGVARVLAATLVVAGPCTAHLTMVSPKPFVPDNGPLARDPLNAGQFPCRPEGGDPANWFSRTRTAPNTMAIGEKQTLAFDGTAIHGGGSCKLALTKDLVPTASSSWQVILSIEGGCPAKDGVTPSSYEFTVPEGITPGDYVFAWTWMSKLAGQREYYMNCAPVTVTGGSGDAPSRRHSDSTTANGEQSEDSHASSNNSTAMARYDTLKQSYLRAASAFPELFVANLKDMNDCKTGDSADVEFPNPGPNVIRPNPNAKFAPITGDLTKCIPKVAAGGAGGQGEGGGVAPPPATLSNTGTGVSSSPSTSAAAGVSTPTTTTTSTSPYAPPPASSSASNSPTIGDSSACSSETHSAGNAPSSTGAGSGFTITTPTTMATTTQPSVAPVLPPAASSTNGSGTTTGGGDSSAVLLSGPCTTEGAYNCDGKSFQRCAAGTWSPAMPLAQGTVCKLGQSDTLWRR
ncbi:uncharacterized protein B0I36DRAFT_382177 [Microdochium trichocladiopsis]|uniref:Carbohydrate-binding module family 19 domain-containing protein n=1 Tax=Microdochium trichocladiopsis TaxID=1682393 RepID=A0A9P8YBZ6_9PEZI|nr:uncharacterized protein B0I36DRAFT_382177 [Microdochium trichocladiopsis]KAH7035482.1 hypothetical protein B0I36DRAFT_382177 [Microdochium trichocladiopsis]